MASLIEKLVTLGRHLPPSHTIPVGSLNEVVAGLAYLSEHGDEFISIAEKEVHEIGDAVHEFFNAHAEKVNEQYRQDHPEAGGAPAGQPSYQELLKRIAALEAAQQPRGNLGSAPASAASPSAAPTSPDAPTAASSTAPSEVPTTVAEIPGAPATAEPSAPASPAAVEQAPEPVAQAAQQASSGEGLPTYEELLQAYQRATIQDTAGKTATIVSGGDQPPSSAPAPPAAPTSSSATGGAGQ